MSNNFLNKKKGDIQEYFIIIIIVVAFGHQGYKIQV